MESLTVDQKLWCVVTFRHGRYLKTPEQCEVKVLKVGRKFADLSNGERLVLATMTLDGGQYSSPGKCYESKDVYDKTEGARLVWNQLKVDFCNSTMPENITQDEIYAARMLLKL